MKRTTNGTMKRTTICSRIVVGAALVSALVPGVAFAAGENYETAAAEPALSSVDARGNGTGDADGSSSLLASVKGSLTEALGEQGTEPRSSVAQKVFSQIDQLHKEQAELTDKVLEYDPDDIAAIGTQASTGHTICCPSFSCAYADAVLDGTVRDHSYYVCSCCMWTDWGGGNSAFRSVGDDEQLLREAYDQIASGRPTVIHVRASYGEHWIALIGYQGAEDPDHLTLANLIALDPWDGAQIVASDRFSLYGDGCEHVSER